MGVITKISLRNIRRRKIRYILTTISLIIGVALFGGVMIAADSFNKLFLDSIDRQMGTADILIASNSTEDGWFNPTTIESALVDIDHIDQISFRISGYKVFVSGVDDGNLDDDSTSTTVYGINQNDPDEPSLGGTPYILDVIEDLNSATTIEEMLNYNDTETHNRVIVITESLKIKLGSDIMAGNKTWILPREANSSYVETNTGTWDEYTIVAVIRDFGEAQFYDPSTSTEATTLSQQGPLLFTNIESTHELVDGNEDHTGEYNLGVIGVDDIYNTEKTAQVVKTILEDLSDGLNWNVYDLKTSNLEEVDTTMTTIRTMFLVFGMIALILSIVLIMNIFNIIRKEQEYETGMFQAIGASKGETFKMFLTQGVVMGLTGSVIGTIGSYFISYLIFSVTMSAIQNMQAAGSLFTMTMDFEIVLLPTTLITVFSVGFLSCLISSIYPSYKASRRPIIECLNPIEEKSKREKRKFIKPLMYTILGIILVISGIWLLFGSLSDTLNFGDTEGGPMIGNEAAIAMSAPTLVLLGTIILASLMVRPFSKLLVKAFSPYLKHTQLLTKKNILRHRKRTVLTFCMISLTTSYLIGMSVMLDSIRAGVDTTIDDLMGADIRLITFNAPRSVEANLSALENVEDVLGVRYQNAMVYVDDQWVGHTQLESDYNISININIIDTEKIQEHFPNIKITSPKDMSQNEMFDALNNGNNIVITEEFAKKYNVNAGDDMNVTYSLDIAYPSLQAMYEQDSSNAHENLVTVEMNVVAIIDKIQGFLSGSSSSFIGSFTGLDTMYAMFVSWNTYNAIAIQYLPGGGTDLIFRQVPETGNPLMDNYMGNWVNFSQVQSVLEGIDGIEHYTSRMESVSLTSTYPSNASLSSYSTTVSGIHTNSTGNIISDSYFGNSTLLYKDGSYTGDTMEELLGNTYDNVAVIDEAFLLDQQKINPTFGIGDSIYIFPQQTNPIPHFLSANITNTVFTFNNGSCPNHPIDSMYLASSDNINKTILSNSGGFLNCTIDFVMMDNATDPLLFTKLSRAISLGIESRVNESIDYLEIYAYNNYTGNFDILGDINDITESNNTFYFNLNGSYIDMYSATMILRIVGYSSIGSNFSLDIDNLNLTIMKSEYSMALPSTWPEFKVIGIINTPVLYNTERYDWENGFEHGFAASTNNIFLSYEHARNDVFPDFKGSNNTNDLVSSILVKCDHPFNISSIKTTLGNSLEGSLGGTWSIVDTTLYALQMRMCVIDLFFWLSGGSDEAVLEEAQQYLQDEGYFVLYGFTRSFAVSTFSTIIDLIMFITYGMLILAIVIALIGLMLHCLLTTMSRRREIGMLRSIGLSKKGVVRSISGETMIIALLGVIIGIFAGILQGTLMVFASPSGGFLAVTYVIPWLTIAILITITIIAAILSSRYPAKWAANINIIDAVRTR
ncbi:MAG: FtsX-like permease family protein [Candidatus Lokiarchaeota archaeon]|nr:FtsX-like permease family protein [Candidatus Lokiarchaeota archaeon]